MKNKILYISIILLIITIIYIFIDNNKLRNYSFTINYNNGYSNISLYMNNTFKANKIIKEVKNIYKEKLTNIEISNKLKKYLDKNVNDYLINTNGVIISKNTKRKNYKIGLYKDKFYHYVNIENQNMITYKGNTEITIIGKDLNKINKIYNNIKNKKNIKKIKNYQIILYNDKLTII